MNVKGKTMKILEENYNLSLKQTFLIQETQMIEKRR